METRSANNVSGINFIDKGPNICRICLANGGPLPGNDHSKGMESIFSTIREYEEKSLYGILVTVCAPLGNREMLKGVPERICRGCKWRLLSAYELYETCLRSDEKMRAAFEARRQEQPQQIQIKQEISDRDEEEYNHNNAPSVDMSTFMSESSYFPEAESTEFLDQSTDLLEEMVPAVDPNESLFEEHYKLNERGNHCCGICEQEFPYKSTCRTHIIVKHDPTKPFKCDVCHFTLTTELRLIRHKATTHGVGVFKIDEVAPEESQGDSIFSCKICSKEFNSIVRLKRHKNVHVAYNRPFKCEICLYRFPNRAQFTQHLKTHQEKADEAEPGSEQDDWKCEHCEEKLPGKRALTMHTRRFHPETLQNEKEKNDYKCIICSEEFARESVLNTHMKMHELMAFEKEKEQRRELELLIKTELQAAKRESLSYTTPVVDTNVSNGNTNTNVNANNNTVSAKKKSDADVAFVCMVCEEEFEERDFLLKHQKNLHKELQLNIVPGAVENADEVPDVSMEDSPEDESMAVDIDPAELMSQPQSENDPTKGPPVPPPMPKCHLCQKSFLYNCLLQTHIKNSHSEAKPFECKVCHMRFGYRGTLQKHELIHSAQNIRPGGHGSIMYKCKICLAKFLELKALTFHIRSHRNSLPVEPTHTKKIEIFQCTYCPQIFNDKEAYDEHQTKQHPLMQSQQTAIKQQPSSTAPPVQSQAHHHSRKNPDPKRLVERVPKNEKELFFDSLSIVKVERQ
ncbi:zinc finger protein 62-like isoform X2 [Topomyia yanbarensis]|uniref:zinc finger protein 62-like isoform X2 n=1 Tax=Topomyia yanbarensis TaxID=2498891 RepID=UPI00273AD0B6|nr:zinc finger protein 62-like isoform X2 [Topomyia yanbarensis]